MSHRGILYESRQYPYEAGTVIVIYEVKKGDVISGIITTLTVAILLTQLGECV